MARKLLDMSARRRVGSQPHGWRELYPYCWARFERTGEPAEFEWNTYMTPVSLARAIAAFAARGWRVTLVGLGDGRGRVTSAERIASEPPLPDRRSHSRVRL